MVGKKLEFEKNLLWGLILEGLILGFMKVS